MNTYVLDFMRGVEIVHSTTYRTPTDLSADYLDKICLRVAKEHGIKPPYETRAYLADHATPDFEKIGAAFDVNADAARTYFEGGSFDEDGFRVICDRMQQVDSHLLDYTGQEYVRRLLIACIKCGVPTDQLVAIERLANGT